MTRARDIGDVYEQLACDYLEAQGLHIVATNWAVAKVGELDIVARQDKRLPNGRHYPTLVCVEVRARRHSQFASATETVTRAKQRRLIATMQHFLQAHPEYADFDVRFDVLAFEVMAEGEYEMVWLPSAFLSES